MDVVSYRGPGVAGGVSSGLGNIWSKHASDNSRWWYLSKNIVEVLAPWSHKSNFMALLPDELIDGHYRFCNEFLWPVLHDLPQYAAYHEENFQQYKSFNRIISEQIDAEATTRRDYFIQDYQLALVPRWLSAYGHRTAIFWHIPWPCNVPEEFRTALAEVAQGMLEASTLGFHTQEYAENFLQFIQKNMPGYQANSTLMTVQKNMAASDKRNIHFSHKSYVLRHDDAASRVQTSSGTQIIVYPLGIDLDFWNQMRAESETVVLPDGLEKILNKRFVLSVDRADYTKAVLDRFLIIDKFFEKFPEQRGKITFVQICGRTRVNLPAFDTYWSSCKALAASVNSRWSRDGWQAIEWQTDPLSSVELSRLYSHASAMMVNPVRDGLNLTAKEFVACQSEKPGVLLLSSGAGAWQELGDYALPISLNQHELSASFVNDSLNMPERERQLRMLSMKTVLVSNQLSDWWSQFSSIPAAAAAQKKTEMESFRPASLG